MRFSLVGIAAVSSLVAACSTTKPPAPAMPAPVASAAAPIAAPAPAPAPAVAMDASSADALSARLRAARDGLNSRSVLFDFDNYTVKPAYEPMLRQQADFAKSDVADHLALQGNSDERGGAEYNLALGQKRADAVRKALVDLGVPADRIEATSFGSEKPRAACHDESCWSQNRRVDFVHADMH